MKITSCERFWKKVQRTNEVDCWNWKGTVNKQNGYGYFHSKESVSKHNKNQVSAHRYSFFLANGYFPDDSKMVLHSCHNRACVNPLHLREGTALENMRDCVESGRRAKDKPNMQGANHPKAKLELKDAIDILTNGMPANETAIKYGISINQVWAIRSGRKWKKAIKNYLNKKETL